MLFKLVDNIEEEFRIEDPNTVADGDRVLIIMIL
jgi:hypothetical protein